MCGDHNCRSILDVSIRGSPPHVRGPLESGYQGSEGSGITPACAGTILFVFVVSQFKRDHPRMCGDHVADFETCDSDQGSPPHVRGPLYLS